MLIRRGKIWYVKFKAGGQVIYRSARTASKREAEEYERQLRSAVQRELKAGRLGLPVERTYREALFRWVENGAPESMLSHARNTRPHLDDVLLTEIIPAAHQMRDDMVKAGLSAQTVNRRLAVVRRVLNLAYKQWGWIQEPLGQKVALLSEKGMSREVFLSKDQVRDLLAAVVDDQARAVIQLAAFTGFRRGELLSLTPAAWQKPYLILSSKTKSKKPRSVPVIEELHDSINLPFTITKHELRVAFEDARKAVNLEHVRLHDLRHTFASWLVQDPKIPLTIVRDLLGHCDLSVTSKYAHLRGDHFDLVTGSLKGLQQGVAENDAGSEEQKYH